ncbi:MAG: phosphoribosylaminoimidazolesuccinocarboxamide synthase [Candidatus Doudnabacteria bacterium]|nr:phosphoribosylaminoimidazolesuccinocarboxamide synthase [bacterium]MDZ4244175.1 phosphoribosylaminoimidazolesuccinocarboxamide synthase [Candidatus Doudnabacteria bacterium]
MTAEMNFPGIGIPKQGKVRDIYDLGSHLLIVVTDRISAFDVVMAETISGKGWVLNQMSALWFQRLAQIITSHMITCNVADYPEVCQPYAEELKGRSMLVKKAKPLPVECVVRGYISGSGWKSYQETGTVCGITLPTGLVESQKLPGPIFTPTTKAESGHDLPITFMQMVDMIGYELAAKTRDTSLLLYLEGVKLSEQAGIIIADTKFEFGLLDGEFILIDELLTPDSSRFWPKDNYEAGRPQKSFDKQFLRDYLLSIGWDQKPPVPTLPPEVINQTGARYIEAYKRLAPLLTA